jgi:UDP-N-acetylglucosamine 2-epimerase (non-hydrolysing)
MQTLTGRMGIMPKPRIMTIVGTRPEIIRLSETIKKLDTYTDHILVFTGQSYDYELSQIFFDELGIREPDHTLDVKADSVGQQIGNILVQCETVLREEKPDAVLVLGDTNSALSCIMAKRLGIRVLHMEAGNRCFDDQVPEEVNRRIVDHTADTNICYTEHARRNLLREGLHPKDIFVLGSPLPEVYSTHEGAIQQSRVLEELDLSPGRYLLASIHREENVSNKKRLFQIIRALGHVAREHKARILFPVHPRTGKELEHYNFVPKNNVVLHKPFGMFDYIHLQQHALCNLSDSGTIHEDAAILGITAVNVRDSHERPEVYDTGNVIMSGVDEEAIAEAVRVAIAQRVAGAVFQVPRDYQDLNYSDKAVRLILSVLGGRR